MLRCVNKQNKVVVRLVAVVMSVLMMLFIGATSVFADTDSSQDALAKKELTTYVSSQLSQKEYAVEGGGTMQGKELFTGSATSGFDLDEANFNKLNSAAQTELVTDIANKSYEAEDKKEKVTEETVQNWWKELQTKKGAGSKFLNVILENTKPDFVTANAIYAPFSGILGTVMGIIAVVGMALLGVVLVADIFYIVIPPVRMLVSDEQTGDGRGSRKGASKIFSNDAIYAIQVAEESNDAGGSKKQALGIYLKRRIPMLILLGICLLYLVQGQIYTMVGWVLDIVSGFLGF